MRRYAALDLIRSIAIINMIVYHAIWDLVFIFRFDWQWYSSDLGYIWQQGICCSFILLSGFCAAMGRRKFKRGAVVFFCGAIVSVVTLIAMPENKIIFGVLTLIGSCMLMAFWGDKGLMRINTWLGVIIFFVLFLLTKDIGDGFLSVGNLKIELPDGLYANLFSAYIGFPPEQFYSTDYFPLIPWGFLFFTGYFLNRIFCENDLMKYLKTRPIKICQFISRNSLTIYMIHQPVIYLILSVLIRD